MSLGAEEASSKKVEVEAPAGLLGLLVGGAPGAAASASERSETSMELAGRRRIVNAEAAAKPVEPVLEARPAVVGKRIIGERCLRRADAGGRHGEAAVAADALGL
jgi:hypothetical protein